MVCVSAGMPLQDPSTGRLALVAGWVQAAGAGPSKRTQQELQRRDPPRTAKAVRDSMALLKASSIHELG
ncbi:hypothetical protein XFF6992_310017 [Xanthomonas citri pv. fuscans]|nr:hypothetical protein XFF6992_310017 [Xanthomonas citri pv. fuscans]SOO33165.1 hypothetical protein XFF6994_2670005 [Xanthomonas citri pv. fuscans]